MKNQIWQHVTSGELYAVVVDDGQSVVDAAGPLHHSEIAAALTGDWDGDVEVWEGIIAEPEAYRDVTERIQA